MGVTFRTHSKNVCKRFLYSKVSSFILEITVIASFYVARGLNRNSCWCIFLLLAKLQLAIGFRSGEFSFFRNGRSPPNKKRLHLIEHRLLEVLSRLPRKKTNNRTPCGVLFSTSFVAATGGHTRLLQTYIKHMPDTKLLVSADAFFLHRRQFVINQEKIIQQLFSNSMCRITLNQSSKILPCRQIDILYQHLSDINPQKIILFNEPSDIALLMATLMYIKNNKGTEGYYYHHADDFLPLFGNAFDHHIDVDHNQDNKCSDISNRSVIRISVPKRMSSAVTEVKSFSVFSFAPVKKIKAGRLHQGSFAELISAFSKEGIRCIIATRHGERGEIVGLLKKHGADLSNIEIDEKCQDISKYSKSVHVYLDTFPIGGGMSVVDGLSIGLPVAIHAGGNNQVFLDPTLSPFTFNNTNDIQIFVRKLKNNPTFRVEVGNIACAIFKKHFDEAVMVDNLKSLIGDKNRK